MLQCCSPLEIPGRDIPIDAISQSQTIMANLPSLRAHDLIGELLRITHGQAKISSATAGF